MKHEVLTCPSQPPSKGPYREPGIEIPKEKPKVFCENCRFFKRVGITCRASQNTISSWKSQEESYRDPPSSINKNNNCRWFKKKPMQCPDILITSTGFIVVCFAIVGISSLIHFLTH